ncbi:NADP-dependent malic enzyme, mitochondrial [Pseudonaja textilis]|uniref:NADP-dependent malic enzyme, mitochondrial n=1 Tax=Pseudonaja textilis TaxID=8673 RepID=UPI000EAA5ECC|nr:NADP-dependent malic enzyme, mitochondrial [Pseudonaja textilis]
MMLKSLRSRGGGSLFRLLGVTPGLQVGILPPNRSCSSRECPPSATKATGIKKRGYDITRNPQLNKGMAFTLQERLQLGIHGLLPPCFLSQDVQVLRVLKSYETKSNDLDKYIILMTLQDRNEKLFYRVLTSDIERFMPIVYTPTVGLACQLYGLAFRRPRGLFITIHDKGHIATMLNSWPEDNIKAVVVTDGERILGLGDLGSYGMGIPVGKLALYTACGGVHPQQCLPVLLDVGTDNEALLNDPLYIGLKHKRVRGKQYDDLLDEFMQAVTNKYGMNCLIQFEDFANANAFRLLNKYRNRYCTFNDDIQGTASVAIAGIFAALRITKNKLSDNTFVFQGAGEAALGIAHLIVMALAKEGIPREEAVKKIWMVDSKGLIVKAIAEEVTEEHLAEGRLYPPLSSIRDVSFKIAVKVVDYAYKHNLASWYPEPEDKEAFVKNLIYSPDYDSFVIDSYQWPQEAMKTQNI